MTKETKMKIKKLKRGRVWPSVVQFFFSLFLALFLMMIELVAYTYYVFESKVEQEQARLISYAENVETKLENGMDYTGIFEGFAMQEMFPEAMLIRDEYGKTIASYGENTLIPGSEFKFNHWGVAGSDVTLVIATDGYLPQDGEAYEKKRSYLFYLDKKSEYLYGGSGLDVGQIMQQIIKAWMKNENEDREMKQAATLFSLSYWQGTEINGTTDILLQKTSFNIYHSDLSIGIFLTAMSATLFIILVLVHFSDVIKAISGQKRMEKLLLIDNVTGGENWLAFRDRAYKLLTQSRYRNTTFALVDFSMTKYQNYCSLHGTDAGEELLARTERLLKKSESKGETHGHYSKGDFALLLKVPDEPGGRKKLLDEVQSLADTLMDRIEEMDAKSKRGQKALTIHNCGALDCRAGVFFITPEFTLDGKSYPRKKHVDVERFYINAGIARNSLEDGDETRVALFNSEMWQQQLWRHKVEERMQSALDKEEFLVYIQPKYDPVSEELVGGEALVRWMSGEDGMIPPGKFVPIFEQTGFVTKLDDYMISHVAKLQSEWLKEGRRIVPISVNVSRAHFAQPDLAEHIRDLVDAYDMPHHFIEIELTESAFFDDKKALLKTVKKLQDYGFDVSMDDFGSGYSSLNSLKDLPLNVLKLDAEFFRGDVFDDRGEIVVSEAIALAKQLNMKIVAEGVEKKEQVDFLAKQKCDMIQGYYYAKPMPADEYSERLRDEAKEPKLLTDTKKEQTKEEPKEEKTEEA